MAQNFVIKPGVLFEDEEIPQQGQVQQVAERIKARVDTRRNALLQMCNRIVRTDVWARAYADLQQIELEFGGPLQTRWNTAYGSNDRANIINVLRDCEAKLLAFEGQHEGAFVLAEHGLATQAAAEMTAKRVMDLLAPEMDRRFSAIDAAQAKLDDTKKALDAATSFGAHVKSLTRSSGNAGWLWTFAIVAVLGGAASFEQNLHIATNTLWYTEVFLRLAVLVPVSFLVYFLLGQYKLARLTNIKYRHVEGLLGGGAHDILKLFDDRPEFAYLVELNLKSRKTIHFVGAHPATDSVTDAQIREFINDFHLLASSDAYFKLRMLEKDPEGAKWIKEIGFADNELLQLGMPLAKPTPMDLFMAAKPAILKLYEFQEWLYTKRFPAS